MIQVSSSTGCDEGCTWQTIDRCVPSGTDWTCTLGRKLPRIGGSGICASVCLPKPQTSSPEKRAEFS